MFTYPKQHKKNSESEWTGKGRKEGNRRKETACKIKREATKEVESRKIVYRIEL